MTGRGQCNVRGAVSSWRCLEPGVCVHIAAASLGGLLAPRLAWAEQKRHSFAEGRELRAGPGAPDVMSSESSEKGLGAIYDWAGTCKKIN